MLTTTATTTTRNVMELLEATNKTEQMSSSLSFSWWKQENLWRRAGWMVIAVCIVLNTCVVEIYNNNELLRFNNIISGKKLLLAARRWAKNNEKFQKSNEDEERKSNSDRHRESMTVRTSERTKKSVVFHPAEPIEVWIVINIPFSEETTNSPNNYNNDNEKSARIV